MTESAIMFLAGVGHGSILVAIFIVARRIL